MRSKTAVWLAFGAALGAAVGVCAYADEGRELLLSGPIEQLDRGMGTVTVLGQKFKAAADQLTVGEVVNVYGQMARDGAITDSLVQGTEKFGTNGDAVFLKGVVTGSDPALGRVEIDGITIDYTAALGSADFSMPALGDVVAVAGTEPATKGVLLASTTGAAAYAMGAPGGGLAAPGATASVGSKAANVYGMTGTGSAAGMTGTGSAANLYGMTGTGSAAGMTGTGSAANLYGMTGTGSAAGMTGTGSAANLYGMTGTGSAAGVMAHGAKTAGMTGTGR